MTKIKVPRLRFSGFSGEWKETKMEDVSDIRDGTHSSPKKQKDGYSLITSKNLKDGHIDFLNVSKISKIDYETINKRSKVDKNDIIFGMIGTIGNPVLIKKGGFAIKNVALIKGNKWVNPNFMLNFLLSIPFENQITMNNEGGTQKFISLKNIRNCIINITECNEQQKIGDFFAKQDKLIELQTQKVDQLKKLKRGYLQKMFPQEGETVPRLRFSEFSEEWNIETLEEYLSIPNLESIDVKKPSQIISVKLNLNGVTTLDDDRTLKLGSTKYYKRKKNQLIYGKQNFFNGSMAIVPSELDGKVSSGDVPSFEIHDIFPNYLFYFISRKDYYKHSEIYASGTGSKRIHENTFLKFPITTPVLDEQQKIGKFFAKLDKLIEEQSNKLDQLKQQKKAYLQKMFV